jgi:hypothetical protein
VHNLLVPEPYTLPGDKCGWKLYNLPAILSAVHFTQQQFVEMCILMGCDYTAAHRSLPYKSAFWSIKYRGPIENTLNYLHIDDHAPYKKAYEILVGSTETTESLMGIKQWEKLAAAAPNVEPDALTEFRKSFLTTMTEHEYAMLCT